MTTATSPTIMQEITAIIKKFKFQELESSVMPLFPETSWNNVKSQLVSHYKPFTSANVAQFIKICLTNAKVPNAVLKDRLLTLEVVDVSRHSKSKIWYGYALIGSKNSTNYLINRDILTKIMNQFRTFNMKISVKLVTYDNITYVSLKEERSKKKKQRSLPVFFALFAGQKYFFCSRKDVTSDYVKAITRSMGYQDSKKFKLMGRDLKSLSILCWQRKQCSLDLESIDKVPVYEDAPPDIKCTGVNFAQHKQRKKYADKCLGDDPPTLELLVVDGTDQSWASKDMLSVLPSKNLNITWEFRSRNIAMCFKKLIERRIIVVPVPDYISNLMTLGENKLTLQKNELLRKSDNV